MIASIAVQRWLVLGRCGVLALAAMSTISQAQGFALHNGDAVVFYGDSITAQHLYTKDIEEFVLTRYPALRVRFVNAGVPGDTTYGGYAGAMAERVQRDVAAFHPAMISVMLGMNDGGYVREDAKIDAVFQKGYRELLAAFSKAAPNAAITLISPSPYDEITHGTEFPGYAHVLERNAEDVSRIAAKTTAESQASGNQAVLFADAHSPLTQALERAKTQSPQLAPLIIPDRIHPGEIGHWIIAATILAAWHVDPTVSRLALDGAKAEVVDKSRTTVSDLKKVATNLQWVQLDEALPLPLDFNNAMTLVLLHVSDIAKLDQLMLRIQSLETGNYELLIDAKPIAVFSSEELQRGVNLALYKTPMLDQARGIDWTEERRGHLDQARFILSAEVKQTSASADAEATLQKAEDELESAIRTNLTPKPHHFELRRK
jgi:lysophospholipase L1-like esterase